MANEDPGEEGDDLSIFVAACAIFPRPAKSIVSLRALASITQERAVDVSPSEAGRLVIVLKSSLSSKQNDGDVSFLHRAPATFVSSK